MNWRYAKFATSTDSRVGIGVIEILVPFFDGYGFHYQSCF